MASWSRPFKKPLTLTDGRAIETLSDSRAYMLALPDHVAQRQAWQSAAALVLDAAGGGDIGAARDQMRRALLFDATLDVTVE